MSKAKNNAIGDLTILLKSPIIWGLKGQNPAVLVKKDGEPCYDYVQEEHASNFPFISQNPTDVEVSRPHEYEHPLSIVILAMQCLRTFPRMPQHIGFQQGPIIHFPSPLVMLPC